VNDFDIIFFAVQVFLDFVVVVINILDEVVLLGYDCLELVFKVVHPADGFVEFRGDFHVLIADGLQDEFEVLAVFVPVVFELLVYEVLLLKVALVVEQEYDKVDSGGDILLLSALEDGVQVEFLDVLLLRILVFQEAVVTLQEQDECFYLTFSERIV